MSVDLNKNRWGRHFSPEEIADARDNNRLLTMEIETSHVCNLRCVYCYSGAGRKQANELSFDEILDAIRQGIDLGVRRVIIIGGGEPMLYPHLFDIIQFLHEHDIAIDLFTNGTLLNSENARRLYDYGVEPVVKCNSLNPQIQDFLSDVPGSFDQIQRGIECLMAAGYPDADHDMGVETIICAQNIQELPTLWRWARDRGLIPYFEMITFQGKAKRRYDLNVPVPELRRLFEDLARIDREEYGHNWEPHPPVAGLSLCAARVFLHDHLDGLCLSLRGGGREGGQCALRHAGQYPARESGDSEHAADPEPHQGRLPRVRAGRGVLRVPGHGLPPHGRFSGAGPALLAQSETPAKRLGRREGTHGMTETDPMPVPSFQPRPVGPLVPQAPPMLLLDTLMHYDLESGEAQTVVRPDSLFLEPSGELAAPALVEMVAQLVAARQGYEALSHPEALTQGLLVGVQEFSIRNTARVGDTLRITAQQVLRVDQAVVVRGELWRGTDLLASGMVKIWEVESLPDGTRETPPSDSGLKQEGFHFFTEEAKESLCPVARAFLPCIRAWKVSKIPGTGQTDTSLSARGTCFLPPDFPAFQGHFPGFPILPAVAMLEIGRVAFQATAGYPLTLTGVTRAKFTQLIRPEEEIEFSVETLGRGKENRNMPSDPAEVRARVHLLVGGRSAASFLLHARHSKEGV